MTCKNALKLGVKTLLDVDAMKKKGCFEIPDEFIPPQPWQRLELVVDDCTHSFIVTYVVEEGHGGGLLVVRNDTELSKPNNRPPWGEAVLSYPSLDDEKVVNLHV